MRFVLEREGIGKRGWRFFNRKFPEKMKGFDEMDVEISEG